MCVNLAQYLEINFTGEVGDVQVKLAAALKRAEEAEGRAARLALDARDRGNKCDALRKRCYSLSCVGVRLLRSCRGAFGEAS